MRLSETAGVIWSVMVRFSDGELHMWIWSVWEQFCNKKKTGGGSFPYGKADEFLKILLSKFNSSFWPKKVPFVCSKCTFDILLFD